MRKWHRWLVVFFGAFLLWISVTGVLSQVPMLGEAFGGADDDAPARVAAPAGFVCPPDFVCRPRPPKGAWNTGLLHHLHSGEFFGPAGTVIGLLSGLALVFFSFSGLWMYIQMWRNRSQKNLKPGWFWQ